MLHVVIAIAVKTELKKKKKKKNSHRESYEGKDVYVGITTL